MSRRIASKAYGKAHGKKNKLAYFSAPTGIHIGPMSIHRAAAFYAGTSSDSTSSVNNPKNPVNPV
jgi:hypothetical protein